MNRGSVVARTGIILFTGIPVLFVLGLVIARWPEWWAWIIFEQTPMTWLEATLLYTSALLAGVCAMITFIDRKNRDALYWLVISMGFAYLCFDERFAIHERVRDSLLAPNNIRPSFLPWIAAGDFILLIFMLIGLGLLYWLIVVFKERRSAFIVFICGVVIACAAILLDSRDVHNHTIYFQRVEQFIEELMETTAMICFVSAIWLILVQKTDNLIHKKTN